MISSVSATTQAVAASPASLPLASDMQVASEILAQETAEDIKDAKAGAQATDAQGAYDPSKVSWLDTNEILGARSNDPAAQAQLKRVMQQLSANGELALHFSSQAATPAAAPTAPAATSFDVKSWGDPHIDETIGKTTQQQNNMNSLNDLVDLNGAIKGGYQVSTTVSAPTSSGVTYNKSASIVLDNGYKVTAKKAASGKDSFVVTYGGLRQVLRAGQTITIPDGTGTISVDKNGNLSVKAKTGNNSVTTNVTDNGNGFDVDTFGQSAYLGGYGSDQFANAYNSTQTLET